MKCSTRRRLKQRGWGALFAILLMGFYVMVWRPVRAGYARHVAYNVLASAQTERAQRFSLDAASVPRAVLIRSLEDSAAQPVSITAPVGFLFLVPALALIFFFPFRLYWLYYGAIHMALGLLDLAATGVGVGWSAWGFEGHRFLHDYVLIAVSLGAVPATLIWNREGFASLEKRQTET